MKSPENMETKNKYKKYENYDIIILSDYNKGVFKNNWFKNNGNIVVLDPKKSNNHLFKNSSIITPNLDELSILSGIKKYCE